MTREDERHAAWKLEAESLGEFKVRMLVSRLPQLSEDRLKFFDAWVSMLDADKRDARDAETLSITRQARSDAKWANIIAIVAMVLATAATIITALIGVQCPDSSSRARH